MITLPNPRSSTQEVLHTLITKGSVSILDYPHLSGFRTRMSEISRKYQLNIETVMSKRHNKFGNPYKYAIHKLPKTSKDKAIEIYKKMAYR